MVLDESYNAGGDFDDQPPSSDGDPYSPSLSESNLNIDMSNMPKPIPIFGLSSDKSAKLIKRRIEQMKTILQRPVTQDEATATAYWTMKQISVSSYGAPIGICGGAWRAYNTAGTYRFPFWQPDLATFRTDVWPSPRLTIFSGPLAKIAWHSSRVFVYAFIGRSIGSLLFQSYAMSVGAVGELTDPRMKDYVQAVRKAQQSKGRVPIQPQQPRKVDGVQQNDNSPPWKNQGREVGGDDASPTTGTYGDTDDSAGALFRRGMSTSSPDPKNQQESRQIDVRWPQARNSNPTSEEEVSKADSPGEAFDDASPTSGNAVLGDREPASGSAWERIRQQARSSPANKNQGSSWPRVQGEQPASARQNAWTRHAATQDGESSSEGFTYSKSDEDKQLARHEAQAEFDERVERERRGGNFNSDSGNPRRP